MTTYDRMEIITDRLQIGIIVVLVSFIGAVLPASLGMALVGDLLSIGRDSETFFTVYLTITSVLMTWLSVYLYKNKWLIS